MLDWRAAVLACVFALPGPSVAQTAAYPAKPLRIIAPFPPGGSVDAVARLVALELTKLVGQQIAVDNRSGVSDNIAWRSRERAG